MPADYVMMGSAFENTDGTAIKLANINFGSDFTGPEFGDGTSFVKIAPQVQIANVDTEGTSKPYYFISDGKYDPTNPKAVNGYVPGWVKEDGSEVDPTIDAGLGFWYLDTYNVSREFNGCGQVVSDSPWDKTFNADYRMLVCPFPIDVSVADIDFLDIDASAPEFGDGSSFVKTATQLQIPNATTEGFSKPIYYISDGKYDPSNPKAVNGYVPGWVKEDGSEVNPTTLIIPAGRGAWFRPAVEMTVNFYINGKPKAE